MGKKSPKEPILRKPRITIITPETTMAAKRVEKPCCISPAPKVVIAARITTTNPFPGPVIVTLEPPKNCYYRTTYNCCYNSRNWWSSRC